MKEKIKVLIVEDEAIIAMLLVRKLEKLGHMVCTTVPSGEEAIEITKNSDPSIILMDIHLAGKIDGIEAAYKINDLKKIPIIFITGYSEKEVKNRTDDLNPLDILYKPVDINHIAKIIDKLEIS